MKVKITNISRPCVKGGRRTMSMIGNLQGDIKLDATVCVIGDPLQKDYDIKCVNTPLVTSIIEIGSNIKRVITESGSVYEIEEIE